MSYNIWYISKYAVHPKHGKPSRQYFFCKYFAKKGKEVTLISSRSAALSNPPNFFWKNCQETFEKEGYKGVLLNGPKINLGLNPLRLWSWISFEIRLIVWAIFSKQKKPDIIIVSSLSLLSFLTGTLLKKYFKCKLVCEVRDIWPLTVIEAKNWSPRNFLIKFLSFAEATGYKNANSIIGTMPNLKAHVRNVVPTAAFKVSHVPMGFDPEFYTGNLFNEDPFKDIFEKIVPSKNFTVGYAGAIGNANCVDQIIQAANFLKNKPITFLILGDGPLKDELLQRTIKNKQHNVIFIDAVKKELVQSFLERCHLLVNPWKSTKFLYDYGVSPNKWIDYMYSGRPILVSFNGFKSIIDEAGCGKFIKADDPLLMAQNIEKFSMMDHCELDIMGAKGKEYLTKNLSYEKLSEKYLNIIESDFEPFSSIKIATSDHKLKVNLEPKMREKILEEQLG